MKHLKNLSLAWVHLYDRPECILNGDFDGDGLLDILVVTAGNSEIYWNMGTASNMVFNWTKTSPVPRINSDCAIIRVGDFDGDGVSEILYNVKGERTFNILKNNGNRKYTPFRKPETITDDSNPDSIKTYTIYYSPDNERIKSVYKCNKDNVTTYYLPDYEEENANGVITSRHYIFSDFGNLAAVVFKKGDKSETYYAITDNLGSVLKLVDDKVKSKYEATYTPFGVRTITKNNLGYKFPRGFTMHEHLDQFSLINANARLYDPYLAQFLSPDPLIQDPTNRQNFNRFSYCLNNPLKYTDPTGEFAWMAFGLNILSGAIISGTTSQLSGGNFWKGALIGGISSAAGSLISYGGIISRGATMAGINVCINGIYNTMNGEKFFYNCGSTAVSGFISGGLEGGLIASETGKNIWWGNEKWNKVLYDFRLPNGNLPIYTQPDPTVGCTQETLKSIGDYLCQPVTITSYTQGEDFAQLARQNFFDVKRIATNPFLVGAELQKGNPAAITYDNGGTMHTVGINRITITKYKMTSPDHFKCKGIISVMDPLNIHYQRLSFQSFNNGFVRVVKPWILLCSKTSY